MRAVIDTNVLISGLLWRGPPHALIEHLRTGALTLISSSALLTEFSEVLSRPKFQEILLRSAVRPNDLSAELRRLAEIFDPPPMPTRISRDPDDDAVLSLAVASQADMIVSGEAEALRIISNA